LRNHLHESLAIDFAVVPTIAFEFFYVFFVLSVDRRRVLNFNVTRHPTADWTAQQVVDACAFEAPERFLFRDNDKLYGKYFEARVDGLGLTQVPTAFRSPWQNPFADRWIGGLRRDCLDHVIAVNELQLRRVIKSYIAYFHEDRTHSTLQKETPFERPVDDGEGDVIAFPRAEVDGAEVPLYASGSELGGPKTASSAGMGFTRPSLQSSAYTLEGAPSTYISTQPPLSASLSGSHGTHFFVVRSQTKSSEQNTQRQYWCCTSSPARSTLAGWTFPWRHQMPIRPGYSWGVPSSQEVPSRAGQPSLPSFAAAQPA